MNLSLKKYFQFGYRKFLGPILQYGSYKLETYDDNKQPIMSTTFYLDGDVISEIYEDDKKVILAESNPDKVEAHMKTVEERIGSLDVLLTQVQGLFAFIVTSVTLLITTIKYGITAGIGATVGVSAILYWLRKYFLKGAIWVVKTFILPSIKNIF